MEKLKPHHALSSIKAAFADPGKLNRTVTAMRGAEALGMDDRTVVEVIAVLTRQDFDKSMTSLASPTSWQDVYKPTVGGRQLYLKFTVDAQGSLLLISFKENEP